MPEARYVRGLSNAEQKALRELYRQTQDTDVRTRCQMILLSSQEYSVSEIAELTWFIATSHDEIKELLRLAKQNLDARKGG